MCTCWVITSVHVHGETWYWPKRILCSAWLSHNAVFFFFFVVVSLFFSGWCGSLIVQCSGLFDGSIKPFLRRNILALSQAPTQLFITCSAVKWLQALENRVRVGGWGQLSLVLRSCCDTVMLMICGSVLVLSEQQSMTRLESWLVGFVCDLHVCSCLW